MSQVPPANVPNNGSNYQEQHSESSTPTVPSPHINPGDHGALYDRLRNQVEFYFSPQNLARDTYLRNMLTAKHQEVPSPPPLQLMTPVAVITNFPKVRDICAAFGAPLLDPPYVLLARACKGSHVVSVSTDGAWIGPTSQTLPPLVASTPRLGPPTPQSRFHHIPYPPSPDQRMRLMPATPMGGVQHMPPMSQSNSGLQNVPLSRDSVSPSSNSLDSMPDQTTDTVVIVPDMPMECNPILLMTAFTTDKIRPSSVSVDSNSNTWSVSFASKMDALTAIKASKNKSVAGAPINARLKSESELAVSDTSLPSISAGQQQSQTLQQPIPIPDRHVMYPPGAYPMTQLPPPPHLYPAHHHIDPQYNIAPMHMMNQPIVQPMYPYFVPQHGQLPFPMHQPPVIGRFGPGIPPPPPRYHVPPYSHQHDSHSQHQGHTTRQLVGEGRSLTNFNIQDGGQKKNDNVGKRKKNKNSNNSSEVRSTQHSGNHYSNDNTSASNDFRRGKGRNGNSFNRSSGSELPAFNQRRESENQSSKLTNKSNSTSDNKQNDRDIFSATDFPGLSGDVQNPKQQENSLQKTETIVFSGYADALLKKGDVESKTDKETNATIETDISDVDSITRQTEAIEREILSDFHDLRIPGDNHHDEAGNNQHDNLSKSKAVNHDRMLPGMPDIGSCLPLESTPNDTVKDLQPIENTHSASISVVDPSAEATHPNDNEEEGKSSWGKRLFSEVRSQLNYCELCD